MFLNNFVDGRQPEIRERVEPNPRPINPTPKPTAELIPKDHYPPTYPPTDPR